MKSLLELLMGDDQDFLILQARAEKLTASLTAIVFAQTEKNLPSITSACLADAIDQTTKALPAMPALPTGGKLIITIGPIGPVPAFPIVFEVGKKEK